MAKIGSVCVFCGASEGTDPIYVEAAGELGRLLGESGVDLIYGGARIGVMGALAKAAMAAGSHVTGIIPGHILEIEPSMKDVNQLLEVDTMHERKMLMFEKSDAFISLPGGIGTLDETTELLTWRQLGLHAKPLVLVNLANFWTPFLALINHLIEEQFAPQEIRDLLHVVQEPGEVLPLLHALAEPETRPAPIVHHL